jgi:hypothetical protein
VRGIAAPPVFHSPIDPDAMLIGWCVLALTAFAIAAVLAVRNRDLLPVAACVGALICALNEPIYDVLANLVYAETPHTAYHAFGRDIPWTLVVGYVAWVGLVPYVLSRMMVAGVSRLRLHQVAVGLILSVAAAEILNAVWLKSWHYYGQSSWRGVLGGGVVQMAAMPLLCALLYYMLDAGMRRWRRALLGLVIPGVALPMVFAASTWPLYLANHAALPVGIKWAAAALSVSLCFVAVPVITRVAQRWREGELALAAAGSAGAGVGDGGGPGGGEGAAAREGAGADVPKDLAIGRTMYAQSPTIRSR